MNYARSEGGVVVDVLRVDPASVWPGDLAKQYRATAQDVQVGWLDAGEGYAAPPPPAPRVPQVVEAWQAKRALVDMGQYAIVDAAIASLPDDPESLGIKVDWASAKTFRRDWPALIALAAELKLDSDDLDALFVHAASL